MSNIKEEFLALHQEIQELEKQSDEIYKKKREITNKRDELAGLYLLDEAVLSEVNWKLHSQYSPKLSCAKRSSDWKSLSDIFETDYHCYVKIDNETTLAFHDGNIELSFNSMECLAKFVKIHKIKIVYSDIASSYNKAKKDMEKLAPLMELFKE